MIDDKPAKECIRRDPVAWHVSRSPVAFRDAEAFMQERAAGICQHQGRELIWLLEHPSVYTAGTSTQGRDLLDPDRFSVIKTGRGGQYTYHGPGQRVVYVMLDLRERGGCDVRKFVARLHEWVIDALAPLGVAGERRSDRVGVWVERQDAGCGDRDDKIAAIGIRLVRWISLHGFSLNVSVDLSHYDGIVACGIKNHGVTSLEELGVGRSMERVDIELKRAFCAKFGADVIEADARDPVLEFR